MSTVSTKKRLKCDVEYMLEDLREACFEIIDESEKRRASAEKTNDWIQIHLAATTDNCVHILLAAMLRLHVLDFEGDGDLGRFWDLQRELCVISDLMGGRESATLRGVELYKTELGIKKKNCYTSST